MLAGERLAHERRRLQAFSRKMLTSLQRAFSAAKVPTLASSCSFDSTKEEGVPRLRDPFVVSDRVALTQLCSWRNAKGLQRFAACAFATCTRLQRSQTLPQVRRRFRRLLRYSLGSFPGFAEEPAPAAGSPAAEAGATTRDSRALLPRYPESSPLRYTRAPWRFMDASSGFTRSKDTRWIPLT